MSALLCGAVTDSRRHCRPRPRSRRSCHDGPLECFRLLASPAQRCANVTQRAWQARALRVLHKFAFEHVGLRHLRAAILARRAFARCSGTARVSKRRRVIAELLVLAARSCSTAKTGCPPLHGLLTDGPPSVSYVRLCRSRPSGSVSRPVFGRRVEPEER